MNIIILTHTTSGSPVAHVRIRLLCSHFHLAISTSGFANFEPFTCLPKVYNVHNNMLLKLIASKTEKTKNWAVPRKRLFRQESDIRSDRRFVCRLHPAHGPLRFITSHSRFALASTMRKTKRLRRRLSHGKATQQNEETYISYIAKCSVLMTVRWTVHEIHMYSIQQKKNNSNIKINEQTAKKDTINSFFFNYNSRINICYSPA